MFTSTQNGSAQRAALGLIARVGVWESLPYLLRAYTLHDDQARNLSSRLVERWFLRRARVFVGPSPAMVSEICDLIRHPALPERWRFELTTMLEPARRA